MISHIRSCHSAARVLAHRAVLFALLIAATSAAAARTYPFAEFDCSIDVPDSGWALMGERMPIPNDGGTMLLALSSDRMSALLAAVSDASLAEATSVDDLHDVVRGLTGGGAVIDSSAVTRIAGHRAFLVTTSIPAKGSSPLHHAALYLIPTVRRVYAVMLTGVVTDVHPDRTPEAQALLSGLVIRPAADSASAGGSGKGLGSTIEIIVAIAVVVIVAVVMSIRRARTRGTEQQD